MNEYNLTLHSLYKFNEYERLSISSCQQEATLNTTTTNFYHSYKLKLSVTPELVVSESCKMLC